MSRQSKHPAAPPHGGADLLPRVAEGVVLRRLASSDLAAFQSYRQDPEVARYQDWAPRSDAEAGAFLAAMSTAPLLQPGAWSQIGIAEAKGADLIGDIGLLLASDGHQVEIGFGLRRQSQGRGMATAAVREAIRLVFEQTSAQRVVGIVDSRNLPSIRLLERVGMKVTGSHEAEFRGEPCLEYVYAIDR